jgi:SAM-dependent methyltransferase
MADKLYIDNAEATEAWNTVLFDRFSEFRHIFVTALKQFSDDALTVDPPAIGDRVIDVGCGFGDTTRQLAELVGPEGMAVGVDAAERFIDVSKAEATEEGVANAEYFVADVQTELPGGPYDYAFGRMGTMFFANPVAAMRNVCQSLRPGGRLCMVVWRQKLDNEWMYFSEQVVDGILPPPDAEESDALTCGPGPFSMANADTTSGVLKAAGFTHIGFRRVDIEYFVGADTDEAVEVAFAIGPAAETIRLSGEAGEAAAPQIEAGLRELAERYKVEDGSVVAPASAWIVTARRPG